MNYSRKHIKLLMFAIVFLTAAGKIFAVGNGKIAFVNVSGGNNEIFTMNSDGSNQTNITNNPANDYSPAWSFDGSKIVFARIPKSNNDSDIYTMNADGTNQVRLTNDGSSRNPSWSPDGSKIVFAKGFDIYLMNADGTNPTRLPTINYNDDPEFSPDGSRISYLCSRPFDGVPPGLNDEICVMNADGTSERILSKNPAAEYGAMWSPDGSKIAFVSQRTPRGDSNGAAEIYVMNVDGSNQVNLSNNPASESSPAWLPDGTKIAFFSGRDNPGIYLMNPDGTNQTFFIANASSATWQRVAKSAAAFDFDGDGKTDIAVFRPSNGYWYVSKSSGGYSFIQWGASADLPVAGDYDGDGRADAAVYRKSADSTWYILKSSDNTFLAKQWGATNIESQLLLTDAPMPADYDGDGKTDLAVYRLTDAIGETGRFVVLQSLTNSRVSTDLGNHLFRTVPADYDGDGRTDYAIFRGGVWSILQNSISTFRTEYFGLASDKLVPADYDGDGKADIAVWRPSNGYWYWISSRDKSFNSIQFGSSEDKPVPGDYDGDGKTDFAVFRPSNGVWYIQQSSKGFRVEQFGLSTDIPIPNVLVR